jgi:hypothetical protein
VIAGRIFLLASIDLTRDFCLTVVNKDGEDAQYTSISNEMKKERSELVEEGKLTFGMIDASDDVVDPESFFAELDLDLV